MSGALRCEATVFPTDWTQARCSRNSTGETLGVRLCTQHRKVAERHQQTSPGHLPYYMPKPRTGATQ